MSELSEYFLNSKSDIVQLECIKISHSKFTQDYYVVRNATQGVTVIHEDTTSQLYEYYPLRCSLSGPRDDLDQILRVDFGDLGEIIPMEIDAVRTENGFDEYPLLEYRVYRSDDLTTVLYGPLMLEIPDFQNNDEGCFFEAKAPSLNVNLTGEVYTPARFPMLKGFL